MELMGAQVLQRLASEGDARAHRSNAVREYGRTVREEEEYAQALRRRDEALRRRLRAAERARGSSPPGGEPQTERRSWASPIVVGVEGASPVYRFTSSLLSFSFGCLLDAAH
ncbi:MAG: hypothetical protein U5R31_17525 [Acidimicrobiia bacterium]|nr:hypothetical protein [Acidimicrobiia bacterium]